MLARKEKQIHTSIEANFINLKRIYIMKVNNKEFNRGSVVVTVMHMIMKYENKYSYIRTRTTYLFSIFQLIQDSAYFFNHFK